MGSLSIALGFIVLLSLLCVAGLAILWWFALRRPRTRRPSCGSCGYAVEGLEVLTCPECGSDLRKVGIETPKGRMLHPGLFVLFWTVLLIAPMGTANTIALRLGPKRTTVDASFGMGAATSSMPDLQVDLTMVSKGFGRGVAATSTGTTTTTQNDKTTTRFVFPTISFEVGSMTVDVRTLVDAAKMRPANLILDTRTYSTGALERSAFDPVFGDSSDAVSRTLSAEDEADVIALLDALLCGEVEYTSTRLVPAGSTRVFARSRMVPWYPFALIAVGAAIYAMGILLYFMMRRTRLAHSTP